MNKQIEEKNRSICETCLHYYECWQADEETVACSRYLDDKEWRKSTDVAREIFEEIEKFLKSQEALSENKRLKEVGDWIFHDYLPSRLAEFRKKYESEGADYEMPEVPFPKPQKDKPLTDCIYYDKELDCCKSLSDWSEPMPLLQSCISSPCGYYKRKEKTDE